jgi:hypothetical protein
MLAASVASVVSTNAWALYAPYFVWFLGIAVSAFFTVVAFLAIAGARCLEAAQRRRD